MATSLLIQRSTMKMIPYWRSKLQAANLNLFQGIQFCVH
jgi:hypothetical protein